jgi:spore maturation protein CgeB
MSKAFEESICSEPATAQNAVRSLQSALPRLLIVGNPEDSHVGAHFKGSSEFLGWQSSMIDIRSAYCGPRLLKALLWRFDRRPFHLQTFSKEILETCRRERPTYLLTTGLAPVTAEELTEIGREGVTRLNFLTDDPWNVLQHSRWFENSLVHYDHVFSPRLANLDDLKSIGCRNVHYLPFAYSSFVHFPEIDVRPSAADADVVFAGGADTDRLPYMRALIAAGVRLSLYGGYWNQHKDLKPYWQGNVSATRLRQVTSRAKVAICLVRRANRDGHCMRTFEVVAMGACMLTEDTPEHRELFGNDGDAVLYFRSIAEMVDKTQWLLSNDTERNRLAAAAHTRITTRGNTYTDRLQTMIDCASRGLNH